MFAWSKRVLEPQFIYKKVPCESRKSLLHFSDVFFERTHVARYPQLHGS